MPRKDGEATFPCALRGHETIWLGSRTAHNQPQDKR